MFQYNLLWPRQGPVNKDTRKGIELNQYINKRAVIQLIQIKGLPARLFGPTVKAVCWNIAFCLRAVLLLFIAGEVMRTCVNYHITLITVFGLLCLFVSLKIFFFFYLFKIICLHIRILEST